MFKRFTDSFEVHLCRRGVWAVERLGLTAPEARELGESEFRRSGVDGLRIVRARESRITGTVTEDLMVERMRVAPPADAAIGPIDEVPTCIEVDDLLRPAARLTLQRLFQGWLRSNEVGVTECMISSKLLRQLLDNSSLIRSALHHAVALQTAEGDDPAVARARLTGLTAAVEARTREAESWVVANLKGDPARLLASLKHPGEDAGTWRSCAAVAAYLSPYPSRLAKVEALVALAQANDDPRSLHLLDLFLADYVMDEDIALELAGPLPFLSDRLLWIAAATLGASPKGSRPAANGRHAFADPLPGLIADGRLPRTGFALQLAIDAVLRRGGPLNDGSPGREQRAVLDLVQCLGSGSGFGGGPRLAVRLARRFAAVAAPATADSFLEAVDTIVVGLPDANVQIRFLLALLSATNPAKIQAGLLAIANRAFGLYGGLKRLARRARSARAVVAEFDALCLLIDQAYVEHATREAWTGIALGVLDEAVGARITGGELSVHELLALAESDVAVSKAVRQTLVRRLSRSAGIVT